MWYPWRLQSWEGVGENHLSSRYGAIYVRKPEKKNLLFFLKINAFIGLMILSLVCRWSCHHLSHQSATHARSTKTVSRPGTGSNLHWRFLQLHYERRLRNSPERVRLQFLRYETIYLHFGRTNRDLRTAQNLERLQSGGLMTKIVLRGTLLICFAIRTKEGTSALNLARTARKLQRSYWSWRLQRFLLCKWAWELEWNFVCKLPTRGPSIDSHHTTSVTRVYNYFQ